MIEITPSFIVELMKTPQLFPESVIRKLSKQVSGMSIFEACARDEITPEQGAMIMQFQNEKDSAIGRAFQYIKRMVSML